MQFVAIIFYIRSDNTLSKLYIHWMTTTKKFIDDLSYEIIGSAIEVHKALGPGLLESTYESCLIRELKIRGISTTSQQIIPLVYKGLQLDAKLRYDILVEDQIILELKSIESLLPIHEAVLMTYLKLLAKPKGILLNFNCTNIFSFGQKTIVTDYYAKLR